MKKKYQKNKGHVNREIVAQMRKFLQIYECDRLYQKKSNFQLL